MINGDQEIIGVLQAINKLPLGFFFSNEEQTALFKKKIQLLTDKYLDEFF